jgi:hypothetical protein
MSFPHFPKWVRKDIMEVLLQLTGFEGDKSKDKLYDHIFNKMKMKVSVSMPTENQFQNVSKNKTQQTSLFD